MHPQLIPGLPLQSFGLCVGIGVMLGWMVVDRLARPRDLSGLILLLVIAGVAGARLAHVIEYWHQDGFDAHLLRAFRFWEGGLVFYGGLIAASAAFLVWWRVRRVDFFATADILAVALPLGHAFGRLGCFFNGCCWGRRSDAWYAVRFPATSFCGSDPVIPTQLLESAALFTLFAALFFIYRRFRRYTTALYLIAYGMLRFGIEFLRADDRPDLGGLSSAQVVSLAALAIGLVFLGINLRHRGAQLPCDHR
ncbi:MAG: prolipoprotein diacylglyceryl transferase [Kiritimatiellia bacterium]